MRRITLWGLALVTVLGRFSVSHPLLGNKPPRHFPGNRVFGRLCLMRHG